MRVYHVIVTAVVAGAAVPVALHRAAFGGFNPHQIALAFFLWLNVIIALWEMCLLLRIDLIAEQHRRFAAEYRGRELARVKDFFLKPLTPAAIFSTATWAELWATYAIFDDSYADRRSFGFFVDVGNGFSSILPSLFLLYGMTYAPIPARWLGVVGLLVFYQMLYCTAVYFFTFVYHRRWVGHRPGNVALFVGLSNGLWLLFPAWGVAVSLDLVATGSYALLR